MRIGEARRVAMVTQFAAAVPVRELGERVASLAEAWAVVGDAMDMLVSGFEVLRFNKSTMKSINSDPRS